MDTLRVAAPCGAVRGFDLDLPFGDAVLDVGEIVISRGLRIEGRVEGAAGRAVADASVHWIVRVSDDLELRRGLLRGDCNTDADGNFILPDLPYGVLELFVSHQDFGTYLRHPPIQLGPRTPSDRLRIQIRPGAQWHLHVTDARGQRISKYLLEAEHWPVVGARTAILQSDDGSIRLGPHRPRKLRVSADGYRGSIVRLPAHGGSIAVLLESGATFVRVVPTSPAPHWWVGILAPGATPPFPKLVRLTASDADVRVSVGRLRVSERQRVLLLADDGRSYGITAALQAHHLHGTRLACEIRSSNSLEVVVSSVASGLPIANARVNARPEGLKVPRSALTGGVTSSYDIVGERLTESDGRVALALPGSFRFRVRVEAIGFAPHEVSLVPGQTVVDVQLTDEGRLEVEWIGGRPGSVLLLAEGSRNPIRPSSIGAAVASFDGLMPGQYRLGERWSVNAARRAASPGDRNAWPGLQEVNIEAGQVTHLRYRPSSPSWIEGRVLPVLRDREELRVSLVPRKLDGGVTTGLSAPVSSRGEFVIGPVVEGAYTLRLHGPRAILPFAAASVDVLSGQAVFVTLHRPRSILIIDGMAAPPTTVMVLDARNRLVHFESVNRNRTTLSIKPGEYTVRFLQRQGETSSSFETRVSIDDEEITLRVPVAPPGR